MTDALGYAAASAVLATFLMRSMVPLRLVAILSNLLFVSYGYLAHIHPVLLLHAALLPINVARLVMHQDCDAFINNACKQLSAASLAVARRVLPFILAWTTGSLVLSACTHTAWVLLHTRHGNMV